MKLAKSVLALSALMASVSTLAGTLTTSSNISLLAFDGQRVRKSTTLQINDTKQHQAVVQVGGIVDSSSGGSYFESDPIIVTFTGSSENIQLVVPDFRSHLDVERFKNTPKFQVKTQSGQELAHKVDYLKTEGFMPNSGSNLEDALTRYNEGNGVAAVSALAIGAPQAMPVMANGNGKVVKGKVMVQGENIAEQQLQYWFQQADKATQQRFLDWAKKR